MEAAPPPLQAAPHAPPPAPGAPAPRPAGPGSTSPSPPNSSSNPVRSEQVDADARLTTEAGEAGPPPAAPGPVEAPPEAGVISSARKSFGFISCAHRVRDVFFHVSALEGCTPEQLREGTAVTFVPQPDPAQPRRTLATRVRLAPVGSRVRLTRDEPGERLGQVVKLPEGLALRRRQRMQEQGAEQQDEVLEPQGALQQERGPQAVQQGEQEAGVGAGGRGVGGGASGAKGIVRFLDECAAPEHLLFDACDVLQEAPPAAAGQAVRGEAAEGQGRVGQEGPELAVGSFVLFRIRTDLRMQQMLQQQQRAQDAPAREEGAGCAPAAAAGSAAAPRAAPRRMAYQSAVAVRPVGPSQLSPTQRHAALVLDMLASAVQVAKELPMPRR